MPRKAIGSNYFAKTGYPIAAVRVRIARGERVSHEHDLTELEHEHDFRELVIVLHGTAHHRLQGRNLRVQTGDVYILQERSRHYFYDIEELELINVMYDPARIPLPHALLRGMPGYSALFLLEPQYRKRHQFSSKLQLDPPALNQAIRIGEQLIAEAAQDAPGKNVMLLARLLELMTFLSRQYGEAQTRQSRELLRIGDVIVSMEQDYRRPWTVSELCARAHMSRSTFLRTFEKAMGLPPIEFLIQRRLDAAARMLRDTDKPVTEIALDAGFSDGNYFARQFRRSRGMTPTEYRTQ